MGNCNAPPKPFEYKADSLTLTSSNKELINLLIEIEKECLQSYENYSLSPVFPSNHFAYSQFLSSNLIFKQQNYDSIIKELKSTNKTYEDESFLLSKETISTEKISRLFYINKPRELYECINQVSFAKETFKLNLNPKSNSNLFNCLMYIQLKNKYWNKNILYKADYKRRIFLIKLYINSLPKLIPLDESIPVTEQFIPLFFNPPEKLYWVLLIEKAFAKVFNSYEDIIDLQASDIFPFLTDAPLVSYYHTMYNKGKIWSIIKEQLKRSEIVFVEGQHCYNLSFFILGCFTVNKNKYIEVIIPDCSNREAIAHIKKNITIPEEDLSQKEIFSDSKVSNDRIIFMKLDFYYVFFDKTHLLRYHNEYINQVKRICIDSKHSSMILFKSKEQSCLLYLSIYKKPKNNMIHRLTMARVIDDEGDQIALKYLRSLYLSSNSLDNTLELNLLPGTYCVIIQGYSRNLNQFIPEKGKISLSFYSSLYLDIIKEEDASYKILYSNIETIMASLFNSYLEEKGTMQSIDNSNEIIYNHSIADVRFGYSLASINNKSRNKMLSVTIAYRIKGMNLLFDNKNEDNSIELLIPPSKSQMVIFEWYKSINEVSIDLKPKFELKEFFALSHELIALTESKPIEPSLDLHYIVIPYFNGEFIIINNHSSINGYKVFADVNEMVNCFAHKVRNESGNRIEIELLIPMNSEKMINVISIKQYKAFSYDISFSYMEHNE